MGAGMESRYLIHLGGKMWALFPWLGSYAFLALERFLKIRCGKRLGLKGLSSSRPYYMQFTMSVTEEEFYKITKEEASADFDPLDSILLNWYIPARCRYLRNTTSLCRRNW